MSSQDNSPDVRRVANGMTEGAGRWTLSRAGIINVYQYDNEILHFAGGRLLLRVSTLREIDGDEHAVALPPGCRHPQHRCRRGTVRYAPQLDAVGQGRAAA